MKKRIDLVLVEKGFASSRAKAQELIKEGLVKIVINGVETKIEQSSFGYADGMISITDSPIRQYVSRGGVKLESALARVKLNLLGKKVLDVGQSTGGFTDCCLQKGAALVVGIDVGHQQLDEKIKSDPRVKYFEGINARDLNPGSEFLRPILPSLENNQFDLAVVDLAFISLTLVLKQIAFMSKEVLALVKPQFEVGAENIGRTGVVKDLHLHALVEEKIKNYALNHSLNVLDYFDSAIEGKDGNKEFFVYIGPKN